MSAVNVNRLMSGTETRVREWIDSCPIPPLLRPPTGREYSTQSHRSAGSASPCLERKSQVLRSFADSGRGKWLLNQLKPHPERRPGTVSTVSPPSVVSHCGASRYRELIDQAIMPGVAITTPNAMAVEVMLEGTEVMVNVSSPLRFACSLRAGCRLFGCRANS